MKASGRIYLIENLWSWLLFSLSRMNRRTEIGVTKVQKCDVSWPHSEEFLWIVFLSTNESRIFHFHGKMRLPSSDLNSANRLHQPSWFWWCHVCFAENWTGILDSYIIPFLIEGIDADEKWRWELMNGWWGVAGQDWEWDRKEIAGHLIDPEENSSNNWA